MSVSALTPLDAFTARPGPVLIVVADGYGIAADVPSNAIAQARTPHIDALQAANLYTELAAHGVAVGLPSDDDMGNSEVGHNAIGAGRVFAQGAKLVNQAFASKSAFASPVWQTLVEHGREHSLHLMGLHSDGNVHSHNAHLYELLEQAAREGIKNVCLHLLTDGRDVAGRSALGYIETTETVLAKLNEQYDVDYRIASGGGRMQITMDRYEADWAMVERGYNCHTHGIGQAFSSAQAAVTAWYEASDKDDQYIPAFVIHRDGQPTGLINDGDAVLFFNFRGDRAIEISKCYEQTNFSHFDRNQHRPHPKVFYAGMLQYDGDELIPEHYLVNPPEIDATMGEYICATGLKSFAVSETQKFGHVTFFWNGNRSGYLDESLETYIEIPSDNIEFDQAPAMKAREITDATIKLIKSGDYAFGRINLANGDMVGHTGNLAAAITAIEVVDECVGRLVEAIREQEGVLIFTADHGNADIMFTEQNGVRTAKTSHTLNPVPFAIFDPHAQGEYAIKTMQGAGLSNIAATTLNLMGYAAPSNYDASLIEFSAKQSTTSSHNE